MAGARHISNFAEKRERPAPRDVPGVQHGNRNGCRRREKRCRPRKVSAQSDRDRSNRTRYGEDAASVLNCCPRVTPARKRLSSWAKSKDPSYLRDVFRSCGVLDCARDDMAVLSALA